MRHLLCYDRRRRRVGGRGRCYGLYGPLFLLPSFHIPETRVVSLPVGRPVRRHATRHSNPKTSHSLACPLGTLEMRLGRHRR